MTPGGHRRYRAADLIAVVGELAGVTTSLTADKLDSLWNASESDAARSAHDERWYAAYDDIEKSIAREQGHEFVHLASEYLAASDGRPEIANRVMSLAERYGRQAARVGVSLGDLMAAFGHFRRPLFTAIEQGEVGDDGAAAQDGRTIAAALLDLAEFLDVFTIRMVEAYVDSVLAPLTVRTEARRSRST